MKDKMRCASCGAMFKPSKSSQTKCENCEKRERAQRAVAKQTGVTTARPVVTAPQSVKISGPGASVLGVTAPAVPSPATSAPPPPEAGGYGMDAWREEQRRQALAQREEERRLRHEEEQRARAAQATTYTAQSAHARPADSAARQTRPAKPARPPQAQAPRPIKQPKPAKPIPPKVELTDDLRSAIETRYLELAKPVEFDGIRTQIATELSLPKSVVKKAISDLRGRMSLPSWWDLQAYTGAETDLERIRIAYVPLLPVPDVGVHKALAVQLSMDPRAVYQGIRRIRAEMRLPQYNPPSMHGDDDPADGAPQESPAPPTDAHVS